MALSKKYYEQIAAAFKAEVEKDNEGRQALYNVALQLADAFGKDNERFDEDRFLKACGF